MPRRCRTCHVELVARPYEAEQVEQCPRCDGTFVTHDALVSVAHDDRIPRSEQERRDALARATGIAVDDGDVAIRRCPECSAPMRRHVWAFESGVVVDSCDAHGVWLDPGELQRVEAWSEALRHGTSIDPDPAVTGPEVVTSLADDQTGLRFAPGSVLELLRELER